jgi:hypothetical protein
MREGQWSPDQVQEAIKSSLGKQGAAEDSAEIQKLLSGEYKTPEQMAGTRFFRCGKTLRLPMEDRHLAMAQSCFALLKLPRFVYGQRRSGKSVEETRRALRATNPPNSHRLIDIVVTDVFAATNDDQFNTLYQKMFLSCIVASGNPGVR